jgi:hypothetical protein
MPIPLLWLGAGIAACYAGGVAQKRYKESTLSVDHFPGEGTTGASVINGAIVCCGIWCDGAIIELRGNGLIRAISPERFIQDRSGDQIYIACNDKSQPLINENSLARATSKLYQYSEYHLIKNNCHRFVWQCISGESRPLTSFLELNNALFTHFACPISWQPIN